MYLTEFQLHNYKSYRDSGPIKLKPGFNILTGQNNAGKTALLEGLGLRFQDRPHRSLETAPTPTSQNHAHSRARFRFAVEQAELLDFLKNTSGEVVIPQLKRGSPGAVDDRSALALLLSQNSLHIELTQNSSRFLGSRSKAPYLGLYETMPNHWLLIGRTATGESLFERDFGGSADQANQLEVLLGQHLISRIYSFRAERMNIGVSQFGPNRELDPNARNLPEVMNVLQSNPARFERYNQLVKRVLPQVERITVRPRQEQPQQVEILIWSDDPKLEREDLAVPLMESGTGISQVLAMLYVLVTADFPRIILIDEPNSFLHPGAVRALVEIFREHPWHQYIVSTHSPEFISASNPSTVHILRRTQGTTHVESVDPQQARDLRTLLLEVGSRLSDVFGAESILWVEAPTEQLCFPLIVQQLLKRPLAGVSIVGVLHTGDFDAKKDTRSVFRIYERLTQQGSALLPPAIAFIFDREIRPEKDRADLERESKGRVHFLGRRTYENYLLHAGAIAAVLNEHPPFTEAPTTREHVQKWLDKHIREPKYYGKAKTQDYPQDIDAPKLLDDLFLELSENRLAYNKVEHSLALTEWLLAHAPEELKELSALLDKVLPRQV